LRTKNHRLVLTQQYYVILKDLYRILFHLSLPSQ